MTPEGITIMKKFPDLLLKLGKKNTQKNHLLIFSPDTSADNFSRFPADHMQSSFSQSVLSFSSNVSFHLI